MEDLEVAKDQAMREIEAAQKKQNRRTACCPPERH
jgi:hypothetical protein